MKPRLWKSVARCVVVAVIGLPAASVQGAPGPLVIAHRGLPGLFPEETGPAYEAAVDAGADSLEEDLHLTKDCVLVARHNPWLSDNTDIAVVARTNPLVAARKRTVPGRLVDVAAAQNTGPRQYLTDLIDPARPNSVLEALVVDGEEHVGDWAISDFTLAELKQWIRGTTYDAADERPSRWNGRFPIVTMQEIIDLARARSATTGREISVYPESKNPIWNNRQAAANGCGGQHAFEDAIVKLIKENQLNSRSAPIYVQSFDPASLKYMRSVGLATKVVQLVGGNGVDYRNGDVVYATTDSRTFTDGRPYSWTIAGDGRFFNALLTKAGLAEVRTYADGIGVWKPQVVALELTKERRDALNDRRPMLADVDLVTTGPLVNLAHESGLFVHVYTFRNERRYLPGLFGGDPVLEYLTYFETGIDGVFTDFAASAVSARERFLLRTKPDPSIR